MSVPALASLYESHARSCDPKDFQAQVMRNPHGKSVDDRQVVMILEAIARGLDIAPRDILLDLCCGNGALTDPIFARCRGGLGVDFTPYLIEVAKLNFERSPSRAYELADVQDFLETTLDTGRFTKVLCYGAFQCLSETKAATVLMTLRRRFPNVQRMLIGNLPDLDHAAMFFNENVPSIEHLKDPETPFGIWRTEDEVRKLARDCGWRAQVSRMPSGFYSEGWRFDATLTA